MFGVFKNGHMWSLKNLFFFFSKIEFGSGWAPPPLGLVNHHTFYLIFSKKPSLISTCSLGGQLTKWQNLTLYSGLVQVCLNFASEVSIPPDALLLNLAEHLECWLHLDFCCAPALPPCSPHLDCPAGVMIWRYSISRCAPISNLRGVEGRGGVGGGMVDAGAALLLR